MCMCNMQPGTLHSQMWKAVDSQQDRLVVWPQQRCRREKANEFSLDRTWKRSSSQEHHIRRLSPVVWVGGNRNLCMFFVNKQEWIKRSFQLCHLLLLLMETTCKSDCWQIAQVTGVTMHSATSQPWKDLWNCYCLDAKWKQNGIRGRETLKTHFCLEHLPTVYVMFLVIQEFCFKSFSFPSTF